MNIQPTSQNNTPTFNALYAPKKLSMMRHISRKQLGNIPALQEVSKKFDVFVKPDKKMNPVCILDCTKVGLLALMTVAVPPLGVLAAAALGFVDNFCSGMFYTLGGMFGSLFALLGLMIINTISPLCRDTYSYDITGKKQYADGSEIKTQSYKFADEDGIHKSIDLISQELNSSDKVVFQKTAAKYISETNELDAKTILAILKDKIITNDFKDGKAFNYPIDVNGNKTLLSRFFEIKKTDENAKEYDEIVSIIKSTPNINFHQQDKVGISILENILNYENMDGLDIVKDIEFEHTQYLDKLFDGIKNPEFKEKASKLKIKFNDPIAAMQETDNLKDFQDAALAQLQSPFCDSKKTALELWEKINVLAHGNQNILQNANGTLCNYLPANFRMDL